MEDSTYNFKLVDSIVFSISSSCAHDSDMHKVLIITLLASFITFMAASPMPSQAEIFATATTTSSGEEPTFTIAKRRRTFNCNQDDRLKKIEAQAWADAGAMAEIANEYDSGNQWQPAMHYWMGADSTKAENFWKIRCKFSLVAFTNLKCRLYPTYADNHLSRTRERTKNSSSEFSVS